MSLQLVANHLAQKGRGPDSTLVHMSNREVAGLQALAQKHGGNLSVNPDTGLPEAGFLDSLLPTIAGAGLSYISGGAINPMMAGALVGGITALDSKDLSKGLMAGLGAWGGAGMTEGLMGVGASQLGGAAAAQQTAAEQLADAGAGRGAYIPDDAIARAATPSNFDKLGAGAGQLFSNPGQTMTAIGGGSPWKAAGMLGAAAAPIIADEMVETTTEAPPQDRGKIRPYTYSRQQTYAPQGYQAPQENIGSKERRWFNDSYTAGEPYSAAGGGLVALASGGYTNQNIFRPTTPLPANNMYGASRDAYDYLMGANPPSGGGQTRPYDPNYPINDIHIDDGANLNPPTKGGTGKYVFDPITKQYKWVPDPIKPVDVVAPVFQAPVGGGGGGGGGGGNRQTSPEGAPGEGFSPTSEGAAAVSNFGKNISVISPLAGSLIGAYGNYLARNVDPNYSHEGRNAVSPNDGTGDGLGGISSPTGEPGISGVTAGVGEAGRSTMGTGAPGVTGDPNQGNEGMHSVQGATEGAPGVNGDPNQGNEGMHSVQGPSEGGTTSSSLGMGDSPGMGRDARGGYLQHGQFDQRMARGGLPAPHSFYHQGKYNYHGPQVYADGGGIADIHQYNLGSYSDGGRLLKGPGDGVSDDIPATIGHGQPARLADGEFVVPARIVSEIGNGSTDAGARELYKMMDRIQAGRKKTVGKDQVAKNSKAVRHLPA